MRITVPNPLGPPITFDSSHFSELRSQIPRVPPISQIGRRPHLRLLLVLVIFLVVCTVHPSPPFPPDYKVEWAQEKGLSHIHGDEKGAEGRYGRFVK